MVKKLSKSRIAQLTSGELSRARLMGQISEEDFRKGMNKIWDDWFRRKSYFREERKPRVELFSSAMVDFLLLIF